MAEIKGNTLYEMNQQLMANEKPLTNFEILNRSKSTTKFFERSPNSYFMLLCHEKRDYTIFKLSGLDSATTASKELIECLKNRGSILAIDKAKDNPELAFEIWVRTEEDENLCYYLFNYNEGVIEC